MYLEEGKINNPETISIFTWKPSFTDYPNSIVLEMKYWFKILDRFLKWRRKMFHVSRFASTRFKNARKKKTMSLPLLMYSTRGGKSQKVWVWWQFIFQISSRQVFFCDSVIIWPNSHTQSRATGAHCSAACPVKFCLYPGIQAPQSLWIKSPCLQAPLQQKKKMLCTDETSSVVIST